MLAGIPAASAQEVGTVVAALGSAEVRHGEAGQWQPAAVGQSILVGDALRTGEAGVAKLLFADDAVLGVGSSSELEIERYTVQASATEPRSLVRLRRGRLRALLSEFYATARLRYEIETPTAVVRLPAGSDTITNLDAATGHTLVYAREGAAQVQGTLAVIGPPVDLTSGQATLVQQGKLPAPPRQAAAEELASETRALEVVGTGNPDGLEVDHPVVAAVLLRQEDRPEVAAAGPVTGAETYLSPEVPGETLHERLSPDLRTNTQPIPEFQVAPPGEAPSGRIDVDL